MHSLHCGLPCDEQDAAGLAKLSASVEDVFSSGDLTRVAETLAQMRRCLAVVGEVPPLSSSCLWLCNQYYIDRAFYDHLL